MFFDAPVIKLRRRLWRPPAAIGSPFLRLKFQARQTNLLVRLFYAFNFFTWIRLLREWSLLDSMMTAHPIWAVFWIGSWDSAVFWTKILFAVNIATSAVGAAWPHRRDARIIAFLGLFFVSAALNSDIAGWSRIMPTIADYVLISLVFIALPSANTSNINFNWQTTFVLVLAQITTLCAYASSGLWRVRELIVDILNHRGPMIGWEGLAHAIALFSYVWGKIGLLGPFLMNHPRLMGPGMFVATIFELSSIYIMTRPGFYRAFGLMLVFFHLGFTLTMNLDFDDHLLLVVLFLVGSPFSKSVNLFGTR